MIKFENVEVMGWEAAIRGMRNPMNSWEKSDSIFSKMLFNNLGCWIDIFGNELPPCSSPEEVHQDNKTGLLYNIGPNDLDLMKRLRNAGTDHRKFIRMIVVYVDITAPLYWWKEFDTYKIGTVANSCSTMHKIAEKEFTMEDFSCEHLVKTWTEQEELDTFIFEDTRLGSNPVSPIDGLELIIKLLNNNRGMFITTKDKRYWWQMIQLLPSSYNQRRTVMLNYEVLANIYKSRKNHKLDEWSAHEQRNIDSTSQALYNRYDAYFGFCDWIKTLPYSELITGDDAK